MNSFFCADSSRQAEEDIIGSATNYSTYVLVEYCACWAPEAFDSKGIPENLKRLVDEVRQAGLPIRFLLIGNNQSKARGSTKVLIYEKEEGLSKGYRATEFNVESFDKVAAIANKYLSGETLDCEVEEVVNRDILVCTHGSHDRCCARYGGPFYTQATAAVSQLNLSNVRLWKASHFGGHRFAPTIIDFPEGRYYGVLNRDSFKSILTRTGDIECLNKVYRGWGILPTSIQALERELILHHGWNWFNYEVAYKIIEQNLDNSFIQAELTFKKPDSSIYTYRADLVKDESKTLRLKGSCNASKESEFVKYSVESLHLYSEKMAS